ncbi:MAG: sensor histidine kinase N-terminal domain-containing protein [Proteobacteria bacterium]|nr:sensor histidine kinase N-terminal domain-containing protein [Pseudomonadota bacterium]MBS0495263.1 sensor histidine kinase N-terminal domain-containing protein [Pseudomonadota bacterium]
MRLRSVLLRWLLVPLITLWAIGFRIHYVRTLALANEAYDRTLLGSALAMAEQVSVRDGRLGVDMPDAALEMLESQAQDRIFYRVGCLDPPSAVNGYDDLPAPPPASGTVDGQPVFFDASYRGELVRMVALRRPLYDTPLCRQLLVQVGETLGARQALSRRVLLDAGSLQLTLVAMAALLITLGVHRGLLPLRRIRDEIRARGQGDLTPIRLEGVPREVAPLIEAINLHTDRKRRLNEAHRQFIADASHQLKTPLAVLKAQAAQALVQQDVRAMRGIVQEIHDSTDATSRMVHQLLALARSDPAATATQDLVEPVDLVDLARAVCFDLLTPALARGIELGFDGETPATTPGQPLLLRELVANLVDNAIRYTPAGGEVAVTVRRDNAGHACIEVLDNGPGIAPTEREAVFERFHRLHGSGADGCGLGLAIVRQIAERHGAQIELGDPPEGHGLRVSVRFPR